jgi:hypothetical protein
MVRRDCVTAMARSVGAECAQITGLLHLAWPVLRINDKHVQRFDSARDLVVESEYFLARGAYEAGTSLLDAKGQQFEVLTIRKLRPSYSWKYWGAKHRAWVIALDLKLRQTMSLEDVKRMLLSAIAEHRWHLQGDYTREAIALEINAAKSLEHLYKGISFFGGWP